MKLTNISVFPIKSSKGFSLESSVIENMGIPYDRNFAIINGDNKIITARENPLLLSIQTKIANGFLELSSNENSSIQFLLNKSPKDQSITVGIFDHFTEAIPFNHPINDWISTTIKQPARLVKINSNSLRRMKEKYAPSNQEIIRFADIAPLHLISKSSLVNLNSHLDQPVIAGRFRPNFLIEGSAPYIEDQWKLIQIGDCIFEVAMKTNRCSLITIHPETTERHQKQEPLRTLSKLRKVDNEVSFGIYLIPRKLGVIRKGDVVQVLKEIA